MLPRLQTLDGERTVLSDAALPKEAASALDELDFAEPEPWLRNFDWGDAGSGSKKVAAAASDAQGKLGTLKGSAEFDALVVECKRLSARAQTLIDDHRHATR